ncbi:Cytochrome P450 [Quillaja saponaria]|uniref:Cytochrome P450 n=1 Tax=Quillaja saponaria TaxID=32244 RepID=A0AAD7LMJ4_QUISA|nr:Cytochrome P450 [Quillaja saponaria]
MELQIHFALLFAFLLFLFTAFIIVKRSESKTLPPGPPKLPLIGNIHQLIGGLPHESLRNLAKNYGPLMHLQLGELSNVIVSSPEFAKEIMKAHDVIFANRPYLLAPWVLSCDATRSVINLSKLFTALTNAITSRAAFGGFCIADLYPSIKDLQVITGIRPKLEKIQKEINKILDIIIEEHKESKLVNESCPGEADENLLDVLLNFQAKNDLELQLTDNNVKAVILDIFTAGSETSSTIIEWLMSEIMKNPKVMLEAQSEVRRVFDKKGFVDETKFHELKCLKAVVKETLRLHPPLPLLLPRKSSERCEINGYEIPASTKVIINAWAIGRDPNYWTEAEMFKPERFLDSPIDYKGTDFEYIPFGAGRRICPGITFGMANVEVPLAKLLYHFDWKLPNGMKPEEIEMKDRHGVTLKRKGVLNLIPTCYRPK